MSKSVTILFAVGLLIYYWYITIPVIIGCVFFYNLKIKESG